MANETLWCLWVQCFICLREAKHKLWSWGQPSVKFQTTSLKLQSSVLRPCRGIRVMMSVGPIGVAWIAPCALPIWSFSLTGEKKQLVMWMRVDRSLSTTSPGQQRELAVTWSASHGELVNIDHDWNDWMQVCHNCQTTSIDTELAFQVLIEVNA